MANATQKTKKVYYVSDYGGLEDTFDTLKDARECYRRLGCGRFARIESVTTETIVITTKRVIQAKN